MVEGNPFDGIRVKNAGLEAAAAGGIYKYTTTTTAFLSIILPSHSIDPSLAMFMADGQPSWSLVSDLNFCLEPLLYNGPLSTIELSPVVLARTLVISNPFLNQIQLVREYCRAHSTRRMHDVAAVNRKSQDAGAFRKKCGKKEQNDVHALYGDVHDEDMKEVTGLDVICLYVNCCHRDSSGYERFDLQGSASTA